MYSNSSNDFTNYVFTILSTILSGISGFSSPGILRSGAKELLQLARWIISMGKYRLLIQFAHYCSPYAGSTVEGQGKALSPQGFHPVYGTRKR